MTHKFINSTRFYAIVGSLLFLGACGNGHDHYAPIGIVLTENGDMIAAQEQNTITYATGDAIYIPEGASTGAITVEFLSDDGTHFTPERSGSSLGYHIGITEILDITHPAGSNEWSFQLTGKQSGSTTLQFELIHDGHADFTSMEFEVVVEESEGEE